MEEWGMKNIGTTNGDNEGMENGVRMDYSNMNLTIDCLAFADDLAIFSNYLDTASKQFSPNRQGTSSKYRPPDLH